jgi:anaerobic selenocysteine-containing dehydrogenase
VLMHREDMAARGLMDGDRVDIVSHFNSTTRRAPSFVCVPYDVPRRCVATYFPEANVLVPLESFAAKSQTPTSKSVVVTIHARGEGASASP